MLTSRVLPVAVLGLSLFAAGCLAPVDDGDAAPVGEGPMLTPMDGPDGTSGTNGEDIDTHAEVVPLAIKAMSFMLYNPANPASMDLNPAIETLGIVNSPARAEVFSYMIRCALQPTQTVYYWQHSNHSTGGGIMGNTANWVTRGLTTFEKEGVLECMGAHLNPNNVHVPLFISGPKASQNVYASDAGFDFYEALWRVDIDKYNHPHYTIWPMSNILTLCGGITGAEVWFNSRTCPSSASTCGLEFRYDIDSDCTGTDGQYRCSGAGVSATSKPVLMTMLQSNHADLPLQTACQGGQ